MAESQQTSGQIYANAARQAFMGANVLANRDKYNTMGQLYGVTNLINSAANASGYGAETSGIVNQGVGAIGQLGSRNPVTQVAGATNLVQAGNSASAALGGPSFSGQTGTQVSAGAQGLGAAASGYNLIKNWDEMSNAERALAGANTANQVYTAGNSLSAAFAGGSAAASGGSAAAAGAGGAAAGSASMIAQGLGAIGAAYSVYSIYKGAGDWDQKSRGRGTVDGAAAGASIGTAILPGVGTAIGAGIGAVAGFAATYLQTGKSVEETERFQLRQGLVKYGLAEQGATTEDGSSSNENVYLTLANGNKFDISGERMEGEYVTDAGGNVIRDTIKEGKTVYDPSKIDMSNPFIADRSEEERNKVRPYDVDTTCDLDMFTNVAAKGLQKVMFNGQEGQQYEKMAGYMTNAATSSAQTRDFTKENFTESMANMKAFALKAGIKDEAMFTNNAKQLLDDDKIDNDTYNQMLQAGAFIYRGDFQMASDIQASNAKAQQSGQPASPVQSGQAAGFAGKPSGVQIDPGRFRPQLAQAAAQQISQSKPSTEATSSQIAAAMAAGGGQYKR